MLQETQAGRRRQDLRSQMPPQNAPAREAEAGSAWNEAEVVRVVLQASTWFSHPFLLKRFIHRLQAPAA
jgi:hypothetical protein